MNVAQMDMLILAQDVMDQEKRAQDATEVLQNDAQPVEGQEKYLAQELQNV